MTARRLAIFRPLLGALLIALFPVACQERVAGQADFAPPHAGSVQLVETGGGALSLRLNLVGVATALPLQTVGFGGGLKPGQALAIQAVASPRLTAFCITFTLDDRSGGERQMGVLVVLDGATPQIQREWNVDSGAEGDLGYRRESQSFAVSGEAITRSTHRLIVEGVLDKQDCGCFTCQSRTSELYENETYIWNAGAKTFERSAYEKFYVVQPGEGLMTVARKALGDPRLMSRLYRLNPELKPGSVLKENQRLLVERGAAGEKQEPARK